MQMNAQKTSYNLMQSLRRIALLTTAITMTLTTMPVSAFAVDPNELPTGFNVAAGNGAATMGTSGNTMNINQTSQNVIINWNTFNIGQSATVNFNQLNSSSIALNQVNGSANPSQILGTLNANGQVWILNPNGVMFGQNAQVDVAGLLASTGQIDQDNFMAGATSVQLYNMNPNASVVNNGTITVAEGGLVALVGAQVANNGTINARLGKVILGGAEVATLDFTGDGLLTIEAPSQLANGNVVSNNGTINAEGGVVQLTAEAAKYSVDNVINMTGIIQAGGGKVKLNAGKKGKANIRVANNNGISSARGHGVIDVSNSTGAGGSIEMSGGYIALETGATLNANGSTGGGNIHLVANADPLSPSASRTAQGISVWSGATLNANATSSGAGGLIHLETNKNLTSQGNYSARGFDAANAGMVWLQSGGQLSFTGLADLSGQAAGAATGTLRLQTANLNVGGSNSAISGSTLSNQLNYANVDLRGQTINIRDAVNSSAPNTLFLTAGNSNYAGNPILDLLFGHGYVFINNAFNVSNVGLQSPSASGITVGGTQLANAVVQNLYLNTPVLLLSSVINAPNQIVVGRTRDDNGNVQSTGIIQQAFNWVASGGTVLLDGTFNQNATANGAFNFGSTANGGFMNHLTINNNGFNILTDAVTGETQVQANRVTLNADNAANNLLQNAYNMVKNVAGGMLRLGLAFYNDSLNHTSSGVTVVGLNGSPSTINDLTLTASGGTLTNINGNTVRENSGSNAQRALNLTAAGGNTVFNFANYAEAINVNNNVNLSSSVGGTLFDTIDINNGGATYASILGNTVNANQGEAQTGYDITNTGGTLNLAQNNYGALNANTANVTVNGAAGGTTFGNITLAAIGNLFNNITTPVVNVALAGLGQQGVNLVDNLGTVNFLYSNSGETITFDRDITLNGAPGGTTFGTFNLNTMLGNINNVFGQNVIMNTMDDPMRGINLTATGGNLFLFKDSYFPSILTTTRFMHIWGTPAITLFAGLNNAGGAILHRIRFPGDPIGPGNVNNLIPPNTDNLLDASGAQTLESLLSALAPAGPGDEEGIKLCTAKDAAAAAECIADAMESGKTVVMFDITNNKYAVVEENATGQKVEWRPVSQEEIERLLGRSLEI